MLMHSHNLDLHRPKARPDHDHQIAEESRVPLLLTVVCCGDEVCGRSLKILNTDTSTKGPLKRTACSQARLRGAQHWETWTRSLSR
jgi:hypothetical protein